MDSQVAKDGAAVGTLPEVSHQMIADQPRLGDLSAYLADLARRVPDEYERGHRVFEAMVDRLIAADDSLFERFVSCGPAPGVDIGVDREALDSDGNRWAVQVKCYAPTSEVSTADVDSFIAASYPDRYVGKILIATTGRVARHGLRKLGLNRVEVVLLDDLDALGIDWWSLENPSRLLRRVTDRKTLRGDQVRAIDEVLAALGPTGARVQLLRACGTGKTLVMERIAEHFGLAATSNESPLVVFAAPTITLVNQTITAWRAELGGDMPPTLGVCSDVDEPEEDRSAVIRGIHAATIPGEIAKWLATHHDQPRLVVSTHVSLPRLVGALVDSGLRADVLFIDEAHRLTGNSSTIARHTLGVDAPFDRYVFATATPRFIKGTSRIGGDFEYVSMDDSAQFGVPAHTYTFRDAIDDEVLCDYQVAVVVIADADLAGHATVRGSEAVLQVGGEQIQMPVRQLVSHLAMHHAVESYGLRKTLAFNSGIAPSKRWTLDHHKVMSILKARAPVTRHLDGTSTASERRGVLAEMEEHTGDEGFILSNARLLTEGIDVPAVDAVALLAPRRSETDVVQIIGRALRTAPGKQLATVVIPVYIPEIVDSAGARSLDVDSGDWSTAVEVLRRLRTFDEALAETLDNMRLQRAAGGDGLGGVADKIHILGAPFTVDNSIISAVTTRLIDVSTDSWLDRYLECRQWMADHDHRSPRRTKDDLVETQLGGWVRTQRTAFRRGQLDQTRVDRLQAIPGWTWNPFDESWEQSFAELAVWMTNHGYRTPTTSAAGLQERQLGSWVSRQRKAYRNKQLDWARIVRLEAIPGWTWIRDDSWDTTVARLVAWMADQDQRMPNARAADRLESRLGAWVIRQRSAYRAVRLDPARIDRLQAIPGWTWSPFDESWEETFAQLVGWMADNSQRIPGRIEDDPIERRLADWMNKQRSAYRSGQFDPARIDRLQGIPGWTWRLKPIGDVWENTCTELATWMTEHDRQIPNAKSVDRVERQLGVWVIRQRTAYRKGQLDQTRVDRLQAIPGWTWNPFDESWEQSFAELAVWMTNHGYRTPTTSAAGLQERQLGSWVSRQRKAYRNKRLAQARIDRLEAIPGWTWGRS